MRKILSVPAILLCLPLIAVTLLKAEDVRQVYPQQEITGNEPAPVPTSDGTATSIPSPPRLMAIGTVIDSSIYDLQANGTLHTRIATTHDGGMHVTEMVSPDPGFGTRGMKYVYYFNGIFTNFGYVEGSGMGDQRGGFGSVVNYYTPASGLGSVAVMSTHTNLAGRAMGSHWYSFQDAFQGVGAFSPFEGDPFNGLGDCDDFLWPSIAVVNDATGDMAMTARTNAASCTGGIDDIMVVHKAFNDAAWGSGMLLDTLEDPSQWGGGSNNPMMASYDDGHMWIATSDFGTNIYYWESTDGGASWSDRMDVTGYPIAPHNIAPDSSSTEYRPLQNNARQASPDGVPHIVWTSYQARGDSPSDSTYTPGSSSVWQYRTKIEHWDPINGVTTVYRHPLGVSDFAGGTNFAYNVGHPSIGFDESGDIVYVIYEGFVDADQDFTNGFYFGDVYCSYSTDGGATWQDRINITNSPGSDDLYPSVAQVNAQGGFSELPGFSVGDFDGDNDFVMVYQNDDVAGTFLIGDESSPNWDMFFVAPVDLADIPSVGIGDSEGNGGASIPKAFALNQNYPNPFNPSTTISYQLAEDAQVSITVHNMRGQVVRELVNGNREAGTHSVQWNGEDDRGQTVSSGIYLYVMETSGGLRSTRKMVVLK